jgi:hypothetical protein
LAVVDHLQEGVI